MIRTVAWRLRKWRLINFIRMHRMATCLQRSRSKYGCRMRIRSWLETSARMPFSWIARTSISAILPGESQPTRRGYAGPERAAQFDYALVFSSTKFLKSMSVVMTSSIKKKTSSLRRLSRAI